MRSDDFQVAPAAAAGEAVLTLVRQSETAIRSEVRRRLIEPRLLRVVAESDVCQLVLTDLATGLIKGRIRFGCAGQLRAWIRKAAVNHIRKLAEKETAKRRDIRRLCLNAEAALRSVPDKTPDPSRIIEARDLLCWTLEHLPPELRELALQRGEGKTWSELASAFGDTADALRKRLTRALDTLLEQHPGALGP